MPFFDKKEKGSEIMAEKRKDNKGRVLRTGEYYDAKNNRYMFRKMVDGERVTFTADDLASLRKQENELLHMIDKGMRIKSKASKITMNEYFDHWLKMYAKTGRKATTITNYTSYYSTYIQNSAVGKKAMTKISKADCQIIFNKMMDDGLKHTTMANLKSCLNCIFECAIDDDIIVKNPVKNIRLPQTEKKKREAVPQSQISLFMDYVRESYRFSFAYPVFLVLFNTGLRIGELISLTWDDVDFQKDTISVRKTLNRYRKKDYGFTKAISTPKSQSSIRTVAMNPLIKSTLLRLKLQSPIETPELPFVDESGKVRGTVTGFVFLNANGNVWSEPTFNDLLKRIIEAYNKEAEIQGKELLKNFCPHQSRHTYTSAAYEAGLDMKAVSQMLGHASDSVTLTVYTHLSQEKEREQEQIAKAINIS